MNIMGVDIGISNTKVIGKFSEKLTENNSMIRTGSGKEALLKALDCYLEINNLSFSDIDKILLTGVGSTYYNQTKEIRGCPLSIINEFTAIGLGGAYLANNRNAIVVSMGTGTAMVRVFNNEVEHIGGTGVGGGTIAGLAGKITGSTSIMDILRLAENGDLRNTDYFIGDVSKTALQNLPVYATASNLGKVDKYTRNEDLLLGIVNLVLQTIGRIAAFASQYYNTRNIVLIGGLTKINICRSVFDSIEKMFHVNFVIPSNSEYGTAIGCLKADDLDNKRV